MNDIEIVQLYFDRSDLAIAETAKKYGAYLNQIAFNIVRCREDSEEIVQDTFLRTWVSIPPQRPKAFRHFLARITRNLSLDRIRYMSAKMRSAELCELFEELEDGLCSTQESAEKEWELKYIGKLINDFLSAQSKQERIMFIYRYFYFLTIKEIAEKMDIQEHKIKYSLMNTRRKLKSFLESEGVMI